jgi:asparagine synthase (glutamine-hydrolysing)
VLKSAWQDEGWRARESARLLGRSLKTVKAHATRESLFSKVAYYLDEPVADASVLPLWLIAEQAARFAPTLISGHGADDLLGGYPRYHLLQKAKGARRLVPAHFLSGIAPSLPPNVFVRRGGRYLASMADNLDAYLSLLAVFDPGERQELYTDAMKAAIHEKGGSISVMRPHFLDRDLTRNLLALNLNVGLPDLLLAKCDRIMAAHGASLEFPYLDDALVDFAITLPVKVKFGVRSKPLLRLAMKGILPGRIRLRARRDFKVPQSGPTLRVIENAAREILTQERVEASGLFKWPYVEMVLYSSMHNVYRRRQFWALLMFFAWYRAVMES